MRVIPRLVVFLMAVVLGSTSYTASAQSKSALIRILREQGFTGALSGDIHFTPLGTLHCPASEYRVIYFEWYGPANPGSHRAQYRLLFLEGGKRYVGSYVIRDKPVSVGQGTILFGYDKASGNVIGCSDIGTGESAQLDGGGATFEK
jgi:hypothetical protein